MGLMHSRTVPPTISRRAFGAIGALSVLAATTACGSKNGDNGAGKNLTVMITCYPSQYLVQKIGGDLLETVNPVKPGVDPHGLELSVQQVAQMSKADLVVQIEHYQNAVDDAISSQKLKNVVSINDFVKMLPESAAGDAHDHGHEHDHEDEHASDAGGEHAQEHEGHDHAEEEHAHGSDEGGEHAHEGHDHGHEGHDHGGIDPHFWHDPMLMVTAAEGITKKLSEISPDKKATFEKNFTAFKKEMTELDTELKGAFDAVSGERAFVTSHAAFTYLAKRYGLRQIGIAGIDPENEPSTQRLLELSEKVKQEKLNTVFFETTASPKVAKALADKTGVKASELDNLETQLNESKDYAAVMRENSKKLVESWT